MKTPPSWAQVPRHDSCRALQVQASAQLFLQRGHRPVSDAARHDRLESIQVTIHIQRESMRRHTPRDMHADGCDLCLHLCARRPHPRQSLDSGARHSQLAAGVHQRLFHPPDELHRPQRLPPALLIAEAAQIDDGITHQLPRPVIRHVPAPVALEDFHSASSQFLARFQNVGFLRVPPQRDHRRVLQQQQHVADGAGFAPLHQRALQL